MSEHIGICVECREESHEYNPTPEEIASMCAEMRAQNMAEREKMFLDKAHEADYVPKTYRISRFHKS